MRGFRSVILLLALLPLLGCASGSYLSVRRVPRNPLATPLRLLAIGGPKPTDRTRMVLREYDLIDLYEHQSEQALANLQDEIATRPSTGKLYAFAELAYIQADRERSHGNEEKALDLYSAAVAHSYLYLFSPQLKFERSHYDPQFRQACDLYNASLEQLLRIINEQGRLQPGEMYSIRSGPHQLDVRINMQGRWRPEDFARFEFVSDYEVEGLVNRHVTYGLGVPLIAVRNKNESRDPAARFYAKGMSFPVTAVLHASERPCKSPNDVHVVACTLDLYDPLADDRVQVAGYDVPLETDITTPLGYFLDNPEFKISKVATWGLLNPDNASEVAGLYMLEAYDPGKIPVLMVHGLWSSPETWTEMFNDLKSMPDIRHRYQFWTYLYPTGQPFWLSAAQLRRDLHGVRETVDPDHRCPTLDQMVLVGHSMGGLVSRLQSIDSRDDFWRIVSDRPFEELDTDEETRQQIAEIMFFQPNSSVRRVVTIGTPHRGSEFANDYTRWLGRKLIKLPSMIVNTKARVIRDNPDFFQNSSLLAVNTSIDSLSPDSPVFSAMLSAHKAPWTKYHNIVGVIPKRDWLGRISERGDGVVEFDSAHLDDVASEIVVESDHVHVHQHPRAIMEVRRILMDHSQEMYAEMAHRSAIPAAYRSESPVPPTHANPVTPAKRPTLAPPPTAAAIDRAFSIDDKVIPDPIKFKPADGPVRFEITDMIPEPDPILQRLTSPPIGQPSAEHSLAP